MSNLPVVPAMLNGYGTLAVTTASASIATMTVGPLSPAFPAATLPSEMITIRNSVNSAGVLYVCPLGGTCTSSVGIPLAVGEAQSWGLNGTVRPTVIAASTATMIAEW